MKIRQAKKIAVKAICHNHLYRVITVDRAMNRIWKGYTEQQRRGLQAVRRVWLQQV